MWGSSCFSKKNNKGNRQLAFIATYHSGRGRGSREWGVREGKQKQRPQKGEVGGVVSSSDMARLSCQALVSGLSLTLADQLSVREGYSQRGVGNKRRGVGAWELLLSARHKTICDDMMRVPCVCVCVRVCM